MKTAETFDKIMSFLPLGLHVTISSREATVKELLDLLAKFSIKRAKSHEGSNVKIRTLLRELKIYAPPFTYFGPHPIHEEQLGVWIDLVKLHAAEQNGILIQASDHNWPKTKGARYVLEMQDGLTLYRRIGRKKLWHTV